VAEAVPFQDSLVGPAEAYPFKTCSSVWLKPWPFTIRSVLVAEAVAFEDSPVGTAEAAPFQTAFASYSISKHNYDGRVLATATPAR
jgi:hypothetical protein